eukprot:TRINITY_DN3602_c0_g1_i1.p1 TRINITY_DN3602_c0_g1~~TRINITY_DN3602_c0_g1_i1.p1  ORF type:complete len:447 (-),score=123.60 TRINITY_DN3602_c0_g1_i1:240-1580(-)
MDAARIDELKKEMPVSRDLTNTEETMKVLSLATEILSSGADIEELKKATFGSETEKPASPVLVSAVGAAESKMLLQKCPAHHLVCVFAMYGEKNRIRTKAEHENGQDFMATKVKQLEWLFADQPDKTWEVIAVDDGCPDGSKDLAKDAVEKNGLKNVTILDLRNAYKEKNPFFMERGLDEPCKKSRKGGAILYGLLHAASTRPYYPEDKPRLVMYTDSDLSTDMALCGLLSDGVLNKGTSMSMGARYGSPGTFLVKPPDNGAAPHPQSHYEQPNMMRIVLRHYVRVRLLPMLQGIYDTQCAFKCFRAEDLPAILHDVKSMGADFDMELLLCALLHFQKQGVEQAKLCSVAPTLFTEDFAESNFMASSDDPEKPNKTYAGMMTSLVGMHERYVDPASEDAKAAKDLVDFCRDMTWESYKKMHDKLLERGPTLFDHAFTLDELKAAAA